jgi:hypothetical protein
VISTAAFETIVSATSPDVLEQHNVSCNSSDTCTVDTTASKSQQIPVVTSTANSKTSMKNDVISRNDTLTTSTVSTIRVLKPLPIKKKAKATKSSLHQHSTTLNRRTPTPILHSSSTSSPNKRSIGGTGSAHTRSNAGNAELLTGVESNIVGKVANGAKSVHNATSVNSSNSELHHHKSSNKSIINNLMIGKNALKQTNHGDNKDGIMTIRNGLSVRKIIMNTGTLYIYANTHHAEFVRTK